MSEQIQIFLLHAQLGPILSYIIHAEVAWNSTLFWKIESNLGAAHRQEIKQRQEAGKMALMGWWVRWIRSRVYSEGESCPRARWVKEQVFLFYKSNTRDTHEIKKRDANRILHSHHLFFIITVMCLDIKVTQSSKQHNITYNFSSMTQKRSVGCSV